jgi:hypothetical protein
MMYMFLIAGDAIPNGMPRVLAEAFGVLVAETDVSDSSELESRNWDAVVTCEYEAHAGDLRLSLDICAADEVERQPSEAQLALELAQRLGVAVFSGWNGGLPWIRQVALPDGGVTLARVVEADGKHPGFFVEAAEAPIGRNAPRVGHSFPGSRRCWKVKAASIRAASTADLCHGAGCVVTPPVISCSCNQPPANSASTQPGWKASLSRGWLP